MYLTLSKSLPKTHVTHYSWYNNAVVGYDLDFLGYMVIDALKSAINTCELHCNDEKNVLFTSWSVNYNFGKHL